MSCGGFESKQKREDKEYRQPLYQKLTAMEGVELGFQVTQLQQRDGWRNLDWDRGGPSLSLSVCWKHTLFLMAFADGGLKAKCTIAFSLSSPFLLLLRSLSPLSVPLQLPRKTHILRSFLVAGFSIQYTHRATHSHSDIAHSRGRGTGPKCLMLWFQGDSVTAAKGRNRCSSSQIQLVPFFLNTRERKGTAKWQANTRVEYTSTSLVQ